VCSLGARACAGVELGSWNGELVIDSYYFVSPSFIVRELQLHGDQCSTSARRTKEKENQGEKEY
jgi:hypothetical protein